MKLTISTNFTLFNGNAPHVMLRAIYMHNCTKSQQCLLVFFTSKHFFMIRSPRSRNFYLKSALEIQNNVIVCIFKLLQCKLSWCSCTEGQRSFTHKINQVDKNFHSMMQNRFDVINKLHFADKRQTKSFLRGLTTDKKGGC